MSKLVFYSDQILPGAEDVDDRMLTLLEGTRPRIGYLPSSSDPKRQWFQACRDYYRRYRVELDPYFGLDREYDPRKLDLLLSCDAIHLSGGNTFLFQQRLRRRNMFEHLCKHVAAGGVLIGVSAGAILMTPNIRTALLCGDTPPHEDADIAGMGLVEFQFTPHLKEYRPTRREVLEYSRQQQAKVYGCPDGAGIIVDGETIECIGDILVAVNGAAQ